MISIICYTICPIIKRTVCSNKECSIISSIIKQFPNKEKVLKDKFLSTIYDLIECEYLANGLYINDFKKERIYLKTKCITDIEMLDLITKQAYYNKYISEKQTRTIANYLDKINRYLKGWLKLDYTNA